MKFGFNWFVASDELTEIVNIMMRVLQTWYRPFDNASFQRSKTWAF